MSQKNIGLYDRINYIQSSFWLLKLLALMKLIAYRQLKEILIG